VSILVATDREVVVIDIERGSSAPARGIGDRPTCLAADPLVRGRAWCGTHRGGVFRSDDGATWRSPTDGLDVGYLRSVAIDPEQPEVVVVSASSGPYSAYVAGRSDGRLSPSRSRALGARA
jgi:hypothetical protein